MVSFDFDPQSVACTAELKRRYFPDDRIGCRTRLGTRSGFPRAAWQFDVVYSWGVLHHTGAMWDALEKVVSCASPEAAVHLNL